MTERVLRPVLDEAAEDGAEQRPAGFSLPGEAPRPAPLPEGQDDEPLMREAIGALLRRVRLEQGRTLREVADDAQVSLPYLSEIERGRKEPSSEVLAAIRRALGLRLIDLIGGLHLDLASAEAIPARPVAGPAPFGGPRALLLAA
ncbi:helix-turn-helix domain-containing protein [Nocardiopsis composta]|uniref:DNA-binding XRE family transcriptional regulator n=1 Tax=Nocardiopsis composta TaxID=157465 RepID=A0A7W8VEN7_9ACTN|nr:helix-turn-helix transcriptional regulator [Nocardiopsis composta]MBB5433285.1 DNA-binding XRE family transcriptional regulator [Nocardiopsis composta]